MDWAFFKSKDPNLKYDKIELKLKTPGINIPESKEKETIHYYQELLNYRKSFSQPSREREITTNNAEFDKISKTVTKTLEEPVTTEIYQYPDGKYGFGIKKIENGIEITELLYEIVLKNNNVISLTVNGTQNKDLVNIFMISTSFIIKGSKTDLRKYNNTGYLLVKF
jgi:hypothetical protein